VPRVLRLLGSIRHRFVLPSLALGLLALGAVPAPAMEPAPAADPAAPTSALSVRAPAGSFDLSGGIYLFEYLPALKGVDPKLEIYAFLLNVDAVTADQRYGLHVQTRARDSKLRSYFVSDVWFQEAYVWAKTPVGDVHAGKFYRKVGVLWDDSFFGNVQYFNGLKLNPDYGVELVGTRPARALSASPFSLDYSVQYFANNDHVAGSLPGRDVESDPTATLRDTATARLVPTWSLGAGRSLAVGLSGLSGRIERTTGATSQLSFSLSQIAGDVTLTWGPTISYVEVLEQKGIRPALAVDPASGPRLGYLDGTYLLAGVRWQALPRLNLRLNYSQVDYRDLKTTEVEVVPGVVVKLHDKLDLIVEYDGWKSEPRGGPDTFIDKSYNFVLHFSF
jgi:hypothetical protein